MKRLLFALTLSAAVALPALAQPTDSTAPAAPNAPSDNPPPPPPGEGGGPGGHHDRLKFLTEAERAELKKAHDAALAADPALKAEDESMKEKMKASHEAGGPPSAEDKAAFDAFRKKLDEAMIKADPAVAPIIEKIKAHHPHGPGGPGGPGGDKDGPPPAQ